jgi:hypothetical protein
VRRSYSGGAVPDYETHLIADIQHFFDSVTPSFRQRGGRLRFLRWADLNIEIVPSPASTDMLPPAGPLLAIGSPAYNAASQAIEEAAGTLARFAEDNRSVQVMNGALIRDPAVAFVQRTVNAAGQTAFYVAGPSTRGTSGATRYLLTQWRELARRYRGSRPFCVVLRITSADARSWEELHRTPELQGHNFVLRMPRAVRRSRRPPDASWSRPSASRCRRTGGLNLGAAAMSLLSCSHPVMRSRRRPASHFAVPSPADGAEPAMSYSYPC